MVVVDVPRHQLHSCHRRLSLGSLCPTGGMGNGSGYGASSQHFESLPGSVEVGGGSPPLFTLESMGVLTGLPQASERASAQPALRDRRRRAAEEEAALHAAILSIECDKGLPPRATIRDFNRCPDWVDFLHSQMDDAGKITLDHASVCSGLGTVTRVRGCQHVKWTCESLPPLRRLMHDLLPEDVPCYEDMRRIDYSTVPYAPLIVGGTPCQSFSRVGARAGTRDQRGQLFMRQLDILEQHQPLVYVAEQVQGILDKNGEEEAALTRFTEGVKNLDYVPMVKVLCPSAYGGRTRRPRVYIVCTRGDIIRQSGLTFAFPEATGPASPLDWSDQLQSPELVPDSYFDLEGGSYVAYDELRNSVNGFVHAGHVELEQWIGDPRTGQQYRTQHAGNRTPVYSTSGFAPTQKATPTTKYGIHGWGGLVWDLQTNQPRRTMPHESAMLMALHDGLAEPLPESFLMPEKCAATTPDETRRAKVARSAIGNAMHAGVLRAVLDSVDEYMRRALSLCSTDTAPRPVAQPVQEEADECTSAEVLSVCLSTTDAISARSHRIPPDPDPAPPAYGRVPLLCLSQPGGRYKSLDIPMPSVMSVSWAPSDGRYTSASILIHVRGHPTVACTDSGAGVTCASEQYVNLVTKGVYNLVESSVVKKVQSANGQVSPVLGVLVLYATMGGVRVRMPVHVVRDFNFDLLLGNDFMVGRGDISMRLGTYTHYLSEEEAEEAGRESVTVPIRVDRRLSVAKKNSAARYSQRAACRCS